MTPTAASKRCASACRIRASGWNWTTVARKSARKPARSAATRPGGGQPRDAHPGPRREASEKAAAPSCDVASRRSAAKVPRRKKRRRAPARRRARARRSPRGSRRRRSPRRWWDNGHPTTALSPDDEHGGTLGFTSGRDRQGVSPASLRSISKLKMPVSWKSLHLNVSA